MTDLVPGRRLDFAWRRLRYSLEYQGREAHGRPDQQAKGGLRTMEVFEAGVEVQLVTSRMVTEHGARFRAAVERALVRRAREVAALEAGHR